MTVSVRNSDLRKQYDLRSKKAYAKSFHATISLLLGSSSLFLCVALPLMLTAATPWGIGWYLGLVSCAGMLGVIVSLFITFRMKDRATKRSVFQKYLLNEIFGKAAKAPAFAPNSSTKYSGSWNNDSETFHFSFDRYRDEYTLTRKDLLPQLPAGVKRLSDEAARALEATSADLQAANLSTEAKSLIENLVASVSRVAETELSVESRHEVDRILKDADQLVQMSEKLASYNPTKADERLIEGLTILQSDIDVLAESEEESLEQQMGSYTSYLHERSLTI